MQVFNSVRQFSGAAILAAALATGLNAGTASALTFNFSFSGLGNPVSPASVTGTISGLVDNLANQTTGLTATITSATNTPSSGWTIFNNVSEGPGISVFGGQVTSANIVFDQGTQVLWLGNAGISFPELWDSSSNNDNYDTDNSPINSLVFTVQAVPTPGPLPIFGATAAFGFSRRLRRRVNQYRVGSDRAGAISS